MVACHRWGRSGRLNAGVGEGVASDGTEFGSRVSPDREAARTQAGARALLGGRERRGNAPRDGARGATSGLGGPARGWHRSHPVQRLQSLRSCPGHDLSRGARAGAFRPTGARSQPAHLFRDGTREARCPCPRADQVVRYELSLPGAGVRRGNATPGEREAVRGIRRGDRVPGATGEAGVARAVVLAASRQTAPEVAGRSSGRALAGVPRGAGASRGCRSRVGADGRAGTRARSERRRVTATPASL